MRFIIIWFVGLTSFILAIFKGKEEKHRDRCEDIVDDVEYAKCAIERIAKKYNL